MLLSIAMIVVFLMGLVALVISKLLAWKLYPKLSDFFLYVFWAAVVFEILGAVASFL